jgi:hypothetical protein
MLGMARTTLPPYAAWLRVYSPLAAFPEPTRSYWAEYAANAGRPSRAELLAQEREAALLRAAATPARVGPEEELRGAFVLEASPADSGSGAAPADRAGPWLCPLDERLRSWIALESLREEVPEPLLSAFVPPAVLESELAEYARWRVANPARQPGILTATWHVPLWWFIAFTADERSLVLAPEPERGLFFRTSMGRARQRMARGLSVLKRTMGEGVVTDGVEQVARWLEEFHPHSVVELDYGGLASLVNDAVLAADSSVTDVADGLAALSAGEPEGAAAAYERLVERWRDLQALEHAT